MEPLHARFEASRERIGLSALPCEIVTAAPAAIRFQIGGEEKIYLADHRKPNGLYLDHAVERAMELYQALPALPEILRIDDCPELTIPGLPAPDQQVESSCYWDLRKGTGFLRRLFREIVRAELDSTGFDSLTSNVYFLNPDRDLLFQLYDDRGADVAAADGACLQALAVRFQAWMPEEEQERVKLKFLLETDET